MIVIFKLFCDNYNNFITKNSEEINKLKDSLTNSITTIDDQYHYKRDECWVIVQGEATVTLDDKIHTFIEGQVVQIEYGTKHRVENKGKEDLIFIETQTGTYFGEDDIIRIEDDYNRIKWKKRQ